MFKNILYILEFQQIKTNFTYGAIKLKNIVKVLARPFFDRAEKYRAIRL